MPKDTPGSEWSMQKSVEIRLERFEEQFKDRVFVKRDMVFIRAVNQVELRGLVMGVVLAVQTMPWRLKIDLWRSFVNVDLPFLEALDEGWLE